MSVLVLGIGNLLWADEGFGVRAVEALHERWSLPPRVTVVDGGTQGMYLLDHVCAADRVLVLDAIDYGLPPGTLRVFRDEEVPVWSDTAMSLHQATFQDLLSLARLRGRFPARITLIGVQPAVLDDLGGSLSPLVRARLDEAVEIAVAELRAWGIEPTRSPRAARRAAEPRPARTRGLRKPAPERGRCLPHRRCALPQSPARPGARLMCIGVPLQVVQIEGSFAWCEAGDERERLDMRLVGEQPVGSWVLAFHGAARQLMTALEAAQARAGRRALAAVLGGDGEVDEFFADLVGREPELPAHLRKGP